ncbi:MAG: M1 family metallopeptidase [Actinomycetota bacterium]|nr:M1 family metallopeptidase [Actinomycetota bacterium]
MGRTRLVAGALALLVGACTTSTEQARDRPTSTASTSTEPTTTSTTARTRTPPTTTPWATTPATTDTRPASDSAGDPLFPGLGNSGYDVEHYELHLDTRGSGLTATATLTLTALAPLERFNLDLVGLTVDAITVDGNAAADFSRSGRELVVQPATTIAVGATARVTIAYHGEPELIDDPSGPVGLGWYERSEQSFVLAEPLGGATWFPANDHPQDKATFDLRIIVEPGDVAVGPGILAARSELPDGTAYLWQMRQPMATYLASVVTGRFDLVEQAPVGATQIRHALPSGYDADTIEQLAVTADLLTIFTDWFGPYPFDSYGVAIVDIRASQALALENQTLSVLSVDLFDAPLADFAARVQAHELAHQWFGNHVSPRRWDDIWLNEGFATWAEYHWAENHSPGREQEQGIDRYQNLDYGPLKGFPPEDLFDTRMYRRGALTLEALRRTIGHEPFLALCRAWVERFGGTSATTQDFFDLVAERHGSSAQDLVRSWVFDEVMPQLPPEQS